MINVTKTFFPSLSEYSKYLERIWKKEWLTNRGDLVLELEGKLIHYLDVKRLTLTTNGTLPLQIAIKALELKGEIITTPFSYVATTSTIVWEGCTPIFVDIDPYHFTIDENKIEQAITKNTCAILATHVFGNPCNVERIEEIAKKYNLKVIYDAAHCFGVKYKGQSLFNYGDVSTCSFHATKIFHTGEGGCWITNNDELHHKMFYHHNFGHNGTEDFYGIGINAKMNELQAAMGLSVFNHLDVIFEGRKNAVTAYNNTLKGINLQFLKIRDSTEWNYHYFPVVFQSEEKLLSAKNKLNNHKIFPRRYFYPSLSQLCYTGKGNTPISDDISSRILCLPLNHDISMDAIDFIAKIIFLI